MDKNNLTSSVKIAFLLKRKHKNIKRNIENLILMLSKNNANIKNYFIESTYTDSMNRNQKSYNVTLVGIKYIIDNIQKSTTNINELIKYYNTYANKTYIPIILNKRFEISFIDKLKDVLIPLNYILEIQKSVFHGKYRLDGYISELKLAIEYDEELHKYQQEEDKIREQEIHNELGCDFIRVNYKNTDAYNIGIVMRKIMELSKNKKSA